MHQCAKTSTTKNNKEKSKEKKEVEEQKNNPQLFRQEIPNQRHLRNSLEQTDPEIRDTNQNTLWSMFKKEYINPLMESPYKSEIIFGVSLFSAFFILSKIV